MILQHSLRIRLESIKWELLTTNFSSTLNAQLEEEEDLHEPVLLKSFSQFQDLKDFPGVTSSSSCYIFMLKVWICSMISSDSSSSLRIILAPERFEDTLLDQLPAKPF